MDDGKYDEARAHVARLEFPIIVTEYERGKWVTLDGFHRVMKALTHNQDLIDAKIITTAELNTLIPVGAGNEGFITIDEARARAQSECDAEGIDPTLSNAERCGRLIDIQQGSPLMKEERDRKAAFAESPNWNRFKAHSMRVIKELPPTIAERQASKVNSMEAFTSKNLFSMSVSNETVNSWEDDKEQSLKNIKSPHFKKLLESLNSKTQDQDYERWLGILVLVEDKGLKDRNVKKEYDRITGYDYLKDVKEEDRQAIAGRDIKKLYEYVRDNIMTVKSSTEGFVRDPFHQQLLDAGCHSTSIAVAVQDHPVEGKVLVELYTKLNGLTNDDGKRESAYDEYCNTWYGQHADDKLKLIKDTTKALKALEKTFK